MRSKVLGGCVEKSTALVFESGDEVVSLLTRFARDTGQGASRFTAIGAFSDAVLGYFDWERKDYLHLPVREQVEVLALVGDITLHDGEPKVHAHVVVGKRDGTAHGGHLLEAHVRPTLEVVLVESPAQLRRKLDPEAGIPLIDLG